MERLLSRYLLRKPDDGGGAAPPAGDGGAPVASPPPSPGAAAPAPGAAPPAGGAPASTPPPAELYFPQGLPDTMKGKTVNETMDNMAKAINGYRERDAKADIPKDAAGYLNHEGLDGFTVPDGVKPYFEALKEDGVFKAAAEAAAGEKVGRGAFNKIMLSAFETAQKAGILEPPVNAEVERAALLPETAKHLPKAEQDAAIDRRMNDNFAFVDMLVAAEAAKPEGERSISAEDADHAKMMLGDSARGHRFLEFMRNRMANGSAQPLGIGGAPMNDAQKALAAELAKPEMQAGHPQFNRPAYDELMERYKKAFPG